MHSVFCLTTGPKPPPKRFLHIVRSRASSFKWEYPFLSLRSSSIFLRLVPRLLVTSISPFVFPSITCFRRQFVRKVWPIQLAFRFLILCRINTAYVDEICSQGIYIKIYSHLILLPVSDIQTTLYSKILSNTSDFSQKLVVLPKTSMCHKVYKSNVINFVRNS